MINLNSLERDVLDRQTSRCNPGARFAGARFPGGRLPRRSRREFAARSATRLAVGLRSIADRIDSLAEAA
ncbi:MAG: hypothetical protein QOE92_336 [Chloroflexota bacterium]|jgi:hypothetical protein|nr:hypothetical protein [Chloroflexota bacterium]